ncbi:unnamed protein product [Closterium sp. NIES-54]
MILPSTIRIARLSFPLFANIAVKPAPPLPTPPSLSGSYVCALGAQRKRAAADAAAAAAAASSGFFEA